MTFKQRYTIHFKHASFYGAVITSVLFSFLIFFVYTIQKVSIPYEIFLILLLLGRITWTFCEYMIHRFIFHRSDHWGSNIHYILHGIHHAFPSETVFLPIWIRIPVLFMVSFCIVMVGGLYGYPFALGFVIGFSIYGIIHYLMHAKTTIPFLKHLTTHHMHHHEAGSHSAYGVSTELWDKIFGTMPPTGP